VRKKVTFDNHTLRLPSEIIFFLISLLLYWTSLQKGANKEFLSGGTTKLMRNATSIFANRTPTSATTPMMRIMMMLSPPQQKDPSLLLFHVCYVLQWLFWFPSFPLSRWNSCASFGKLSCSGTRFLPQSGHSMSSVPQWVCWYCHNSLLASYPISSPFVLNLVYFRFAMERG
jgi:hypothetical protein